MTKQQTLSDIDAPHFGYWKAIWHSFYDSSVYVDAAKRWKGLSWGYLFLLAVLFSIPMAVQTIYSFNVFYTEQVLPPLTKLPPFMVQSGVVSFDKPMPYLVKNNQGQVVSAIDTTGVLTTIDEKYTNMLILVTKDKIIYRAATLPAFFTSLPDQLSPVITKSFEPNTNQIFDLKAILVSYKLNYFQWLAGAIFYPVIILVFFVTVFTLLLTIAFLAQFAVRVVLRFKMTYGQSFRLLMLAASPVMALCMIVIPFDVIFTGFSALCICLLVMYFGFGALAFKRQSNKLVR